MKLKSLLFGSAAVLAAGTGAQAADLPTVEPVEYVRICDVFGTGFFYIPGTETCLKLSGYVRVETRLIFDDEERAEQLDVDPENVNNYSTRVRGHVEWDARTQTEFGLIRAFIGLEGTRGPQSSTPDGTGPGDSYSYTEDFGLASAFIQVSNDWGTFTTGKFGSFFDFWADYGWNGLGTEPGTEDPNLAAWTFAGGNGFSFSISAEDPDSVDRRRSGDDDYEGLQSPDGVANIRVDQGWGSAQIMGVIHPVHDQFAGDDESSIGWAVGGGLSLGIPGGWSVSTQAGYSEGALHYISGDPDGMGDLDGAPNDDLNTAWAVRAGVTGPVMTNVTAWAQGAFYHFEEDDGTDEYDFIGASGGFAWEPAPGLRMGPEVGYNSVEWDGAFPDDGDYDVWGLMWRMQRSF